MIAIYCNVIHNKNITARNRLCINVNIHGIKIHDCRDSNRKYREVIYDENGFW